MLYATNNCREADDFSLSDLGVLKSFREYLGSSRKDASRRVQTWAGPGRAQAGQESNVEDRGWASTEK